MARPLPLVRAAFESLVSLLAPDVCAGCDERIGIMRVFCPVCANTLVPAGERRTGEHAPFTYGGALARAIASLKYGGRVDRARPLSHLLLQAVEPMRVARRTPTVVVPVPLHRARLAARGYNQASLLAAPVARALGARFAPGALLRVRDAPAQATLGRSARLENVKGAFRARPRAKGADPSCRRRAHHGSDARRVRPRAQERRGSRGGDTRPRTLRGLRPPPRVPSEHESTSRARVHSRPKQIGPLGADAGPFEALALYIAGQREWRRRMAVGRPLWQTEASTN
jgi:predicted amidophosphoribosyltransferase